MDAGTEAALGAQLFAFFLASSWERISASLPSGSTRFLTIASDAPEILNLPWELLRPPGGDFLGLDPLFAIRRLPHPEGQLAAAPKELRPRPLRLLFMACAPTDQAMLDRRGGVFRPSWDKKQQAVTHFNSFSLLQIHCLLTLKAILLDSLRSDPDNVLLPGRKIDLDNALETK